MFDTTQTASKSYFEEYFTPNQQCSEERDDVSITSNLQLQVTMENIMDKCKSKLLRLPTVAEFSSPAAFTKNGGRQSFLHNSGFFYSI